MHGTLDSVRIYHAPHPNTGGLTLPLSERRIFSEQVERGKSPPNGDRVKTDSPIRRHRGCESGQVGAGATVATRTASPANVVEWGSPESPEVASHQREDNGTLRCLLQTQKPSTAPMSCPLCFHESHAPRRARYLHSLNPEQ